MVLNSLRKIQNTGRLIIETNTDIPVSGGTEVLRANVYRPLETENGVRFPVLLTIGPYGKDVHWHDFRAESYNDLPEEQMSEFSAWETPDPVYWTGQGYIIVRIDERGVGQSPGTLDVWNPKTTIDFVDSIEWATDQPWCNGKIGLLGVSYYAINQWWVAARKPKGLACIIPWEGATDLYREVTRPGGIFQNKFLTKWWDRQVKVNQYGLPGKANRNWGVDTIECSLSKEKLAENEVHILDAISSSKYADSQHYSLRNCNLADIEVPLLSVANLGGITLHLRGNVNGYLQASSKNKWLYFITGRHDIPGYLPEYVALQKSFLDAWLKGVDDRGWLKGPNAPGGVPTISLPVRAGNPGYNSDEAERTFVRRNETEWPIARTQYTRYYLGIDKALTREKPTISGRLGYRGLDGDPVQFTTPPFQEETEITGHILARLILSIEAGAGGEIPKDMDLFVTLRHLDAGGDEIYYTGTAGDPVPICKGWLRASLRKIDISHPDHRSYLPYRRYSSDAVDYPQLGKPFEALVDLWPTSVVVAAGNSLVFEIASHGTQGDGIFGADHPDDRSPAVFSGTNVIFVGPVDSWLELPHIPPPCLN